MARPSGRGRRSLTQTVIAALKDRIEGGLVAPGERLPTEQALVSEFGVSRTVIREAVAGLRADGLVEPRQGVGVFVRQPPRPAGPSFLTDIPNKISAIVEALELRAAVEIEAAGLAAQRCSPAQEEKIRECFLDIEACMARAAPTTDADFAFHAAVAEATNNRHFPEFLDFLGRRTIPRSQLGEGRPSPRDVDYMAQIQREHAAILAAIGDRDAERAREAMRIHLKGSQERYRRLLHR